MADQSGADRCCILHVDMDSFFASVEVLDDPVLVGKPVVVGGTGNRGVVASCTYEARIYGIRSGMATAQARRRCPHAVFLAGRFSRYEQESERLHEILRRYTPVVEPLGLDEAFLDVSGSLRLFGSPEQIAASIKAVVFAEMGMTCSVGVGRSKLIAKLASLAAKPVIAGRRVTRGPGVVLVRPDEEIEFLHPLPVRAIWGVGPATAERLGKIGVATVGDLARVPDATLVRLFGRSFGAHLSALSQGQDTRPVVPGQVAKSVGHEETFSADLSDLTELHHHLVRMADAVAARLAESGRAGRTVTLRVRYGDFSRITRSRTVTRPVSNAHAILAIVDPMLDSVDLTPGVRLLGISVGGLVEIGESDASGAMSSRLVSDGWSPSAKYPRQLSFDLFDDSGVPGACPRVHESEENKDAWEGLQTVLCAIRHRYGRDALGPASLLGKDGIDVKRRGERQWGPS